MPARSRSNPDANGATRAESRALFPGAMAILPRLLLASAVACTRSLTPCQAPDECPRDYECLANQCRVQGSDPVAPDTERRVLFATFTHASEPTTALDVGFALPGAVTAASRVQSAYLVLPVDGNLYQAQTALVAEVARVADPEPGRSSDTTGPSAHGRASLGLPLRVNVTPLLQDWVESGAPLGALRIWAFDPSGEPLRLSAPSPADTRLELYLTPRGAE